MTAPTFHDPAGHSWDSGRDSWQQILNAVDIPPFHEQRHMTPVAVRARVVWERDGQETIEGRVGYWAGRAVLVHWRDPRLRVQGAWFDVGDVARVS
ncbi:hypothetical protein GCM10025864_39820 [Luteimicrobium album]|uniref:Uncharacterized protein n=1 Tax=Luteimicrobium album TaxID=1054550 RepID=A0ABQ6I7U7_9MICO|nr:hypothetical protein [Luteimicrobium album]GMA26223.1 hypothetical protein GCM10025864_39820 [Luteimicrobium album]